jgi:hypothetical protein
MTGFPDREKAEKERKGHKVEVRLQFTPSLLSLISFSRLGLDLTRH